MRGKYWLAVGASILLGLIFVTAGVGKLSNQAEFLAVIVPTTLFTPLQARIIAYWLPWIELALGLLLILGISMKFMAGASSLFIVGFIFYNTWVIQHGSGYSGCGCWGDIEEEFQILSSSTAALYSDIGMLALVSIILVFYPGNFLTARPWFLERGRNWAKEKLD